MSKLQRSSIIFSVVLWLSLYDPIQPFSGLEHQFLRYSSSRVSHPTRRRPYDSPSSSRSSTTSTSRLWIRPSRPTRCRQQQHHHMDRLIVLRSSSSSSNRPIRGDALREASGRRPSLHPLTINTVAELLKLRARNHHHHSNKQSSTDTTLTTTTTTTNAPPEPEEPLQVALQAGRVAADAIARRQETSRQDGMQLTTVEEQTVAGRVVGVALRWSVLEAALVTQCRRAPWIARYGEQDSFGVLAEELVTDDNDDDNNSTTGSTAASDDSIRIAVDQRIQQDPLFGLNRAECLLALFLHQVEAPELQRKNITVPDDSVVDFLDADRRKVLLGEDDTE